MGIKQFIKSKQSYLYFVFSRFLGLLFNPLLLWLLMNRSYGNDAYLVSLYFVCLKSCMVIFNNEAHFNYYKIKFHENIKGIRLTRSERDYTDKLTVHIVVFSLIVMLVLLLLTKTPLLVAVFFCVILTEKVLDEVLRMNLFIKDYFRWSNILLAKTITPAVATILSFSQLTKDVAFIYFSVSFIINLLIIHLTVPSYILQNVIKVLKSISYSRLREYAVFYRKNYFLNQLQAFTNGNLMMFDRWLITLLGFGHLLAAYTLIAQMANVVNLIIDYFFVAPRRAIYVKPKLKMSDITNGRFLWLLGAGAISLYLGAIYLYISYFAPEDQPLGLVAAGAIGYFFLAFGITSPFFQYLFWNTKRQLTVTIDLVFFATIALVVGFFYQQNFIESLLIGVALGHTIRFGLLLYHSSRRSNLAFKGI